MLAFSAFAPLAQTAGATTCGAIKALYKADNQCCNSPADTPAHADSFCHDALPCPAAPATGTAPMPAGIRMFNKNMNARFNLLIEDGKLVHVTWDLKTASLTTTQVHAKIKGKPFQNSACEIVPISNEWFEIVEQESMMNVGGKKASVYLRSKMDDAWYAIASEAQDEEGDWVVDFTQPVPLEEFKVAAPGDDRFVSASGSDHMVAMAWPQMTVLQMFNKGYAQSSRPRTSDFPDYGGCIGCAEQYCNLVRYKSGGKFGSWTAAQVNPSDYAAVGGGSRMTAYMNPIYRRDDGVVSHIEGIDKLQFQYIPVMITEKGEVLESRHIQDDIVYGLWPGAAMNTGFYLDNGYHEEWYGNFYSYAAKFHNGEWIGGDMNGATNIDGQWGKAHRFKPAADGSMHDPDDKLAPKDPRITPFDDAKCIVNTGWGWTIVDNDGYVYHNHFSVQGSLASYYNHRFDTSRSPMVSPGGRAITTTLQGGDAISYLPPGDHLRPMVKKSAVDGTMKYVKITGATCQDIENRIAAFYASAHGVYVDDDGYAYVSGLLQDREYAIQNQLKQMYPADIRDVEIDTAAGDAHFRGARVDLPREEYAELYAHDKLYVDDSVGFETGLPISPYTGLPEYNYLDNTVRNHGSVQVLSDVSSVPAAFELANFQDIDITKRAIGKSRGLSTFHGLAGPNYALPVKLMRNGQGAHQLVTNVSSVYPIESGRLIFDNEDDKQKYASPSIMFTMNDGSKKAWFFAKTLNLHPISLNGDVTATSVPENAPSIPYEWRNGVQYMSTNYIQHVEASLNWTSLSNTIATPMPPCSVALCGYDVTPTDPPADFSQQTVNSLTLHVKGAAALTLRAADFPKLKKVVLVDAEHTLKDLTLDGLLLASIEFTTSSHLTLHPSPEGTGVGRVYVHGTGTVPVSWLNSLDNGGASTHVTEVSALLPAGTPLAKGALREIELAEGITLGAGGDNLHDLTLPQLWRLKMMGPLPDAINLQQMFTGCPKLNRLVLPGADVAQVQGMQALGPIGADFADTVTRFSRDEGFPNRVVEVAAEADLEHAMHHLVGSGANVRYLRYSKADGGGDASSLALLPGVKSIDISGVAGISGTLPASSLSHLETLYASDSTVAVSLAELGAHGMIRTLHLENNEHATGSLAALSSCRNLYVLNLQGAAAITGTLDDISGFGCGVHALCPPKHTLRFVDLVGTHVTGPLHALSKHADLSYLNVEGLTGVTGHTSDLADISKLTYLNVAQTAQLPVDADISATGTWVDQFGYGSTCASYRATEQSYTGTDVCGLTVAELAESWTEYGTFTPPTGFTAESKFQDFCPLTCETATRTPLPGVTVGEMHNACGTVSVVPSSSEGGARRLSASPRDDDDLRKAYYDVPHHMA